MFSFAILFVFLFVGFGHSALPITGTESLMTAKAHGTCVTSVPSKLRWNCNHQQADQISCFNRHYAEYAGYFHKDLSLTFISHLVLHAESEVTFYDTVTGKPLFVAPRGRSMDQFLAESKAHGWPSFRDEEVIWENVRCLENGEAVSVDGTHLGHNLPDGKGNRYCINLVSIAGNEGQEVQEVQSIWPEA